jgi:hypothetical protein
MKELKLPEALSDLLVRRKELKLPEPFPGITVLYDEGANIPCGS